MDVDGVYSFTGLLMTEFPHSMQVQHLKLITNSDSASQLYAIRSEPKCFNVSEKESLISQSLIYTDTFTSFCQSAKRRMETHASHTQRYARVVQMCSVGVTLNRQQAPCLNMASFRLHWGVNHIECRDNHIQCSIADNVYSLLQV